MSLVLLVVALCGLPAHSLVGRLLDSSRLQAARAGSGASVDVEAGAHLGLFLDLDSDIGQGFTMDMDVESYNEYEMDFDSDAPAPASRRQSAAEKSGGEAGALDGSWSRDPTDTQERKFVVDLNMTRAHEAGLTAGLKLSIDADKTPISVTAVRSIGLVDEWNRGNLFRAILPGDRIMGFNDVRWQHNSRAFGRDLLSAYDNGRLFRPGGHKTLQLQIWRPALKDATSESPVVADEPDAQDVNAVPQIPMKNSLAQVEAQASVDTQTWSTHELVASLKVPKSLKGQQGHKAAAASVLGWQLAGIDDDSAPVTISKIRRKGLVAEWNAAHPSQALQAGDRIVKVNGVSWHNNSKAFVSQVAKQFEAARNGKRLSIKVQRMVRAATAPSPPPFPAAPSPPPLPPAGRQEAGADHEGSETTVEIVTPSASLAVEKQSGTPEEAGKTPGFMAALVLPKSSGGLSSAKALGWQLDFDLEDDSVPVTVGKIRSTGSVEQWNAAHPSQAIRPGDQITKVNGIPWKSNSKMFVDHISKQVAASRELQKVLYVKVQRQSEDTEGVPSQSDSPKASVAVDVAVGRNDTRAAPPSPETAPSASGTHEDKEGNSTEGRAGGTLGEELQAKSVQLHGSTTRVHSSTVAKTTVKKVAASLLVPKSAGKHGRAVWQKAGVATALGWQLEGLDNDNVPVTISKIRRKGSLAQWNEKHPKHVILVGDQLVKVNDVRWHNNSKVFMDRIIKQFEASSQHGKRLQIEVKRSVTVVDDADVNSDVPETQNGTLEAHAGMEPSEGRNESEDDHEGSESTTASATRSSSPASQEQSEKLVETTKTPSFVAALALPKSTGGLNSAKVLGWKLNVEDDNVPVTVGKILSKGSVAQWNAANPSQDIRLGDQITKVNGHPWHNNSRVFLDRIAKQFAAIKNHAAGAPKRLYVKVERPAQARAGAEVRQSETEPGSPSSDAPPEQRDETATASEGSDAPQKSASDQLPEQEAGAPRASLVETGQEENASEAPVEARKTTDFVADLVLARAAVSALALPEASSGVGSAKLLGWKVSAEDDSVPITIGTIHPLGSVARWNAAHPSQEIRPGDRITSANGVPWRKNSRAFLEGIAKHVAATWDGSERSLNASRLLSVRVQRPGQGAEEASDSPSDGHEAEEARADAGARQGLGEASSGSDAPEKLGEAAADSASSDAPEEKKGTPAPPVKLAADEGMVSMLDTAIRSAGISQGKVHRKVAMLDTSASSVETAVKKDNGSIAGKLEANEFLVPLVVPKSSDPLAKVLGWQLVVEDDQTPVSIGKVRAEGAVAQWNAAHPDQAIFPGDKVIKVNRIPWHNNSKAFADRLYKEVQVSWRAADDEPGQLLFKLQKGNSTREFVNVTAANATRADMRNRSQVALAKQRGAKANVSVARKADTVMKVVERRVRRSEGGGKMREFVAPLVVPKSKDPLVKVLGWQLLVEDDHIPPIIEKVKDTGVVAQWNAAHPDLVIHPGDEVMKVNTVPWHNNTKSFTSRMYKEITRAWQGSDGAPIVLVKVRRYVIGDANESADDEGAEGAEGAVIAGDALMAGGGNESVQSDENSESPEDPVHLGEDDEDDANTQGAGSAGAGSEGARGDEVAESGSTGDESAQGDESDESAEGAKNAGSDESAEGAEVAGSDESAEGAEKAESAEDAKKAEGPEGAKSTESAEAAASPGVESADSARAEKGAPQEDQGSEKLADKIGVLFSAWNKLHPEDEISLGSLPKPR
ncbi:unnamed protein product [Prorocentrum cordatum]|uniref:PDZ domain-containing protein n=1 Tax=Prorocentrum cordatum TaxID=2364126 RepID=A0ABN9X5M3_9DINO|nr:unnamed protein product [Polarella glacialis]